MLNILCSSVHPCDAVDSIITPGIIKSTQAAKPLGNRYLNKKGQVGTKQKALLIRQVSTLQQQRFHTSYDISQLRIEPVYYNMCMG